MDGKIDHTAGRHKGCSGYINTDKINFKTQTIIRKKKGGTFHD